MIDSAQQIRGGQKNNRGSNSRRRLAAGASEALETARFAASLVRVEYERQPHLTEFRQHANFLRSRIL
jgi:hypothetical protein